MRVRRALAAAFAAVLFIVFAGVGPAAAAKDPGGGVSPMVFGGYSFLEVGNDGNLRAWTGEGNRYTSQQLGNGWGGARQITGLRGDRFLELRNNDHLYSWIPVGDIWRTSHQYGPGWNSSKVFTGMDWWHFMEVSGSNVLYEWSFDNGNASWNKRYIGEGWGDTRLLAGLGINYFVQIKTNGELWEWSRYGDTFRGRFMGGGWGNVRLIAGVNVTRFVAVKNDGELVEWNYLGNTYRPTHVGYGWGNARLLG